MRRLDDVSRGKFTGVGQGLHTAIVSRTPGIVSALGFTAGECLDPIVEANRAFGLGSVGLLSGSVAVGKKKTVRFASTLPRPCSSGLSMRKLTRPTWPGCLVRKTPFSPGAIKWSPALPAAANTFPAGSRVGSGEHEIVTKSTIVIRNATSLRLITKR